VGPGKRHLCSDAWERRAINKDLIEAVLHGAECKGEFVECFGAVCESLDLHQGHIGCSDRDVRIACGLDHFDERSSIDEDFRHSTSLFEKSFDLTKVVGGLVDHRQIALMIHIAKKNALPAGGEDTGEVIGDRGLSHAAL